MSEDWAGEDWESLAAPVTPGLAPVRVGMQRRGGRNGRFRLAILLDKAVLEALGGRAWRYQVRLGRGGNLGRALIVQDDAGPFEAVAVGAALVKNRPPVHRLLLPPDDRFPDGPVPAEPVSHSVETHAGRRGLLIHLPGWVHDPAAREARRDAGDPLDIAAFRRGVERLLTAAQLDALRQMARGNGRTIDAEIGAILAEVLADD